jgi:hypothetical protein
MLAPPVCQHHQVAELPTGEVFKVRWTSGDHDQSPGCRAQPVAAEAARSAISLWKTTGVRGPFPPTPSKITYPLSDYKTNSGRIRNFFWGRAGKPIHGHI